jgi:hypothetical protein
MHQDKISPEPKGVKQPEKRGKPRYAIGTIPVEIYDTDGLTILGMGYISNLGINSAGLDTTVNLSRNQQFYMRFPLEKNSIVNVWVTVARIVHDEQKKYYGVQFTKTDILNENNLKEFLEKKFKKT